MVGYLRPYIPELKVQDYRVYQAYCCGVCCQLRKEYGAVARFILNHDMVMMAILADSLAGREGRTLPLRCPRHPLFRRRNVITQTQGIRRVAQTEILLHGQEQRNYGITRTSWRDRLRYRISRRYLNWAYQRARAENIRLERLVMQEKDQAAALEQLHCGDYDRICEPSAYFYAALFASCSPDETSFRNLWQMGFALGKIYFLLESAEHFEEDRAQGRYNVFLQNGLTRDAAMESARSRCNMAAAELARAYNKLDVKMNRTLLDNIIYFGLEQAVEQIGQKQKRKWEFDEQL